MDILILAFLILLNGLFALTEMSLVAANKGRLATLAEAGNRGAAAALALARDPNRILATTQLGLTFVTLLEGSFATHSFVASLAQALPDAAFLLAWREKIASVAVLSCITFATLVLGEMLPKRAALVRPEAIASVMAPWAQRFISLLSPLIGALSFCTNSLMALFGLPLVKSEAVSAEDVETMLEAAGQSGLLSAPEMAIMDNVWRLDERKVGAIMTPRQGIHFIDINGTNQANLDMLAQHPRARLVVAQGGLDSVLGMAPTREWTLSMVTQLRDGIREPKIDWTANLAPALGIPNSLTLLESLESFRQHKTHVALVYNEFGQIEGLVSISDLMDSLVGEMPQSAEQETLIHKDASGKWLIDGLASVSDTKTALGLGELPGEAQANFQTAGGFALWMVGRSKGRLPKEFDEFEHGGYVFQVVDIDRKNGYRIDQIMVESIATRSPRKLAAGI
jgi:putative hemolysin